MSMSKESVATEQVKFHREIMADLKSGKLVLPMFPDVALRVNDLVEDPDASLELVAEVIATDISLSAQLLKVSNSPLFRGRVPVDKVQMAISRLGLKMTRNLVSSLVVEQMFILKSDQLEQRLHQLWQHSVEVAAACHVLASKQSGIHADEAMLAGLVHDIGVLPILLKAEDSPKLLHDAELLDSVIENVSVPIGVAILKSWAFPESLIEVVAEHKNLERDSINGPDLVDVVQVANLQSFSSADGALSADRLDAVPAFEKLGVQTEVHLAEIDENSEDYANALALFG